jgi:hypothetical protein
MSGLTRDDLKQLKAHGIEKADAIEQLRRLREGFLPVDLARAATVGDGIVRLTAEDEPPLLQAHRAAAAAGRLLKFVPASGAASRMFQSLLEAAAAPYTVDLDSLREAARRGEPAAADCLRFFEHRADFPFADRLERELAGHDPSPRELLSALLDERRMNLPSLPKGLIPFHRVDGGARSAFAEHVVEAGLYALDASGVARLHFTVPPEYEAAIAEHLREAIAALGSQAEHFQFDLSVQHGATDTLARRTDGSPLRDASGRLVLRPGGHGALLSNLDDLQADIVFIKNIDNVATGDRAVASRIHKARLCGALLSLQAEIHGRLRAWDDARPDGRELDALEAFCVAHLGLRFRRPVNDAARRERVHRALDRPLRVCGMVPNEGEPGGGPYWVRGEAGTESLQIVEASQIDQSHPDQRAVLEAATHFNPVDLVCGLRNHGGENFELARHVDPETGFVSTKSMDGTELRALELPGLWNGSMAHWSTAFIEVPVFTFTPVKTLLDLLRPEHQPRR